MILLAWENSRYFAMPTLVSPQNDVWEIKRAQQFHTDYVSLPGAPNENIVQNHLNIIALLNIFKYLNGKYRHIFIP